MRKLISFLLAVTLVCSMSIFVHAQDDPTIYTEYFSQEDIHPASSGIAPHLTVSEVVPSEPQVDSQVTINGEPALVEYFSIDEISGASINAEEFGAALYAVTRYFSFDDLLYNNITSDFIEFEVQQGDAVYLDVVSCSWYPHTCKLHVGIYDLETGTGYYTSASGGELVDTLVFADMDESRYMVYVRNTSSATVTDGGIRYSL